jgi:hypothetical protein
MKTVILIASAFFTSLSVFSQNLPLYVAGTFNSWGETVMNDMGGGVWGVTLSGLTPGTEYQFKVNQGDWNWFSPYDPAQGNPNSWFYAGGSGSASISFDLNSYTDGWTVGQYRIGENVDPGAWTAVGAWNGWNNADATSAMTPMGGGIYKLQKIIANPGFYGFKATETGGWDYQVGADGRNINASELTFTTTTANQEVDMFLNAVNGTIMLNVVPEPSSLFLFGLSGLTTFLAVCRRK